MYAFYKTPFVYLTSALVVGVVIGNLDFHSDLLLGGYCILFICSLLLLLWKQSKEVGLNLVVAFSMIGIGTVLFQLENDFGRLNVDELNKYPQILVVQESKTSATGWTRLKCERKGSVIGGKLFAEKSPAVLVMAKFKTSDPFRKGDVIAVKGSFDRIKNSGNPGEFDAEEFWRKKQVLCQSFIQEENIHLIDHINGNLVETRIDDLASYLSSLLDSKFSGEELGVVKAMVVGDRSSLDAESGEVFAKSGAMHVLAVSGLHVGIVLLMLMTFMKWFSRWLKRKYSVLIVVSLLWIYALVTGFSPSVIRSVFMFSVLILAQLSGRNNSQVNTLLFTAFMLLLFNPNYLFDIGFQLSYLAMLGIFLIYPRIENLFESKSWIILKIWQGTAVGLAAQTFTVPLSLYYFHQFPNYFMISNLGLMIFSGIILGLGMLFLLFAKVPLLSAFTGFLLLISLTSLLVFLKFIQELPGAVAYGFDPPLSIVFGFLLMAILFLLIQRKAFRIMSLGVILILLSLVQFRRFERLNSKQVTIFNASHALIMIKEGQNNYCFFDAKWGRAKFDRAIKDYQRVYPGKLVPVPIYKGNSAIHIEGRKWEIQSNTTGTFLKGPVKAGFLVKDAVEREAKTIYATWLQKEQGLHQNALVIPY